MVVLRTAPLLSALCAFSCVQSAVGKPILASLLGPIKDVLTTVASGAGLIEGTLGAIGGVLGAEQT